MLGFCEHELFPLVKKSGNLIFIIRSCSKFPKSQGGLLGQIFVFFPLKKEEERTQITEIEPIALIGKTEKLQDGNNYPI
jgi:hypothetical protein